MQEWTPACHWDILEFHASFPMARSNPSTHGTTMNDDVGSSSSLFALDAASPPRRVLAVDDSTDLLESLAAVLRLLGHDVETAHNGEAALDAIRDWRPDVALVDVGMPGLSGYDVARIVRDVEASPPVLVAMTGWARPSDRAEALEAGFDHHLVKPVDLARLQTLFRDLPPRD